jgi:hypothetical protein
MPAGGTVVSAAAGKRCALPAPGGAQARALVFSCPCLGVAWRVKA